MIRRHSTRLSQAHDDEPGDEQGQHTAARDYPELGSILDDRPDPGRQITVIGSRHQADAYGTQDDARNGDFNGGEQDLGMYWGEPGQQAWRDEHLGPQEEAPPPLYDPDLMPPAMARLAAIEEAQAFFGMSHHATTINGTQVDDAGDAPQHGTVPRAGDPDSYDGASHEGEGDDKWNQALPWGSEEDENGATVGMYPEGISAGGGPGISVGPVTAAMAGGELARHMELEHNFPGQYPGMTADQERMLAEDHAALHDYGGAGHEHEGEPEGWELGADASGGHEFTGMRREARVPWTGRERGTLHRWQEEPTVTWGDFVPSSDFPLLKPGEHVSHEDEGEGIGPVEGSSDAEWERHLRYGHGWGDERIEQARRQGPFRPVHEALHQLGLPDHRHSGGAEDAREEARKSSEDTMFGPAFPRRTPAQMPLARPENGGAGRESPYESIMSSEAAEPPLPHEYFRQFDPARYQRMMSALNVHVRVDGQEVHGHDEDQDNESPAPAHEHDDTGNDLDSPPDNSPGKNGPEIKSPQFSPGIPPDSPADGRTVPDGSGLDPDDPARPDNWPQAGADVTERGRAYTQGSGDGKVTRGVPAPSSPGDGDGGGTGEQGDDAGGGEDRPDDDGIPFSKDGALAMFTAAAGCPAFRFEFTAAWHDVVAKAKRIRAEGHVRITHASVGMVIGEVRGDHDTYESGIQRPVGKRQSIRHWACGCPWASFNQDKSLGTRYAGRPCSHVMALQFEAQSRGMFGRSFDSDAEVPFWSPQTVVVKSWPPYEGDPHAGQWREQWRAPLARRSAAGAGLPYVGQPDDESMTGHVVHHHGLGADAMASFTEGGADHGYWRAWHEAEHRNSTAPTHQHDEPRGVPGERRWPEMFEPEHGFRFDEGGQPTSWFPEGAFGTRHEHFAPMEPHWGSLGAPERRATAVLLRAGEDPGAVGALRLLAGLRATADQANAPWGSDNVSQRPPQKPYGATSPPDKDQDPGSYGFLAGPDPENWGGIQEDSAFQMPLSSTASSGHQVLVPGAPRPQPGDLHWPGMNGWQPESQGTFLYTDRAATAGPATAMDPRDPQGIRMEEARGELRDEPEAALPSTTGDDEIEATAAADGTIGGGTAGTGQGQGAADDTASLGEFGASAMGDLGRETSPQAQQPSPVGQEPGLGSGDDYLSPDDASIQTIGNQQWSGGGADSDEVAVPAGQPQGSIDDIVASFQRSAAALGYSGGPVPGQADGDIAVAARRYLAKTAEVLPKAEADELVREGTGSRARNLDLLRLEGTHYEDEDEELAKKGLSVDDYEDDVIFA